MKKLLRFTSLALVFVMLCFTFCGCDALDEMREKHAFWTNEDKTVISLNSKEYKLLPECEQLNPVCNSYYEYTVTESDVPLLLADMYGESISLSEDEDFIVLEPSYEPNDSFYGETKVYCATDRYEEICNRINSDSLEYFCYEYDTYDFYTDEYISKLYRLTIEEIDAVLTVRKNGEILNKDVDAIYDYADYVIELYQCSEDTIFRTYVFDLVFKDSKAYIVIDFGEYVYAIQSDVQIRAVPDELYDTFRGIASKYIDSMEMDW